MGSAALRRRQQVHYSTLFVQAARLVWRHRFLWLLGLFLGLSDISIGIGRGLFGATASRQWLRVENWLAQLSQGRTSAFGLDRVLGVYLAGGILLLFILALVYWLVVTVAEASLIAAVNDLAGGQAVGLRQALSAGYALLGRFVAIDAIVFFPWFILALGIMLLMMAIMVGGVALALNNAPAEWLLALLGIGIVCLLPLLCLLLPLALVTTVFRTLAFRDAAARQAGVWDSVRHTWTIARQNMGVVLVFLILIWGIHYVFDLVLTLPAIPLISLAIVPEVVGQPAIDGFTAALIGLSLGILALPKAILYAFTATVWTLAYAEISGQ